jgi:hypothetical protein
VEICLHWRKKIGWETWTRTSFSQATGLTNPLLILDLGC